MNRSNTPQSTFDTSLETLPIADTKSHDIKDAMKPSDDKSTPETTHIIPCGVSEQTPDRNSEWALTNFDRFVARFEEFLTFARGINKTVDYYLFPLKKDWKDPDTYGQSWTEERGSLQLTLDAARRRIARQVGNIALAGTCNPEFNKDTLGIGVIDIDLDEDGQFKMPEERVNQLIAELNSFTVRTRTGGYHIYIAVTSEVVKHLFEQYGTYNPLPRYAGQIWGEFRLFNQYVVAVGSYVPPQVESDKKRPRPDATGFYEVHRDAPFRIVNLQTIPSWIEFGRSSGSSKNGGRTRFKKITVDREEIARLVDAGSDRNYSTFTNAMGYALNDIVQSDENLKYLLDSAENHQPYNSRSEADFSVAKKLNECGFSCEQVWAILQTFRPYEKTLSDQYLETTLSKFDWDHPSVDTIADTFPTILPDKRCIIISSLPRTGKSYYGINQMGKCESGIYVSQNHSIITKQFELFNRLYPDKTSVQLYGKERVCNHEVDGQKGRCRDCPLKLRANRSEYSPDESGSMAMLLEAASDIVAKCTHVKPEDIPDEYCKYEMLHCCERYVDFVFTVPQFLTSREDLTKIAKRDIAVFDEDTTFAHFYPHSYSWGTFHSKTNGSFYNTCSLTAQQMGSLKAVRKSVVHARDSKKSPERETLYNAIIGLINGIEEVYTIFTDNSSDSTSARNDSSAAVNRPITELKDRIEQVRFVVDGSETKLSELSDEEKGAILHYLSRRTNGMDTPMDISHICEPYLYPVELEREGLYLENLNPGEPRYSVQGSNPRSLYAIADETRLIHPVDCAEKYILIGFSQARNFAQHIEPNEGERIELAKVRFKYLANYVLLALEGRDEKNKRIAHIADKRMRAAIRTFMAQNERDRKQVGGSTPAFILTSSKSNQQRIRDQYHNRLFDARKEDIEEITQEWGAGKSIVLYQNSVISRGIDIPFGDAMFVDKCHFAQPYLNYLLECTDTLLMDGTINREKSETIKATLWDRKNTFIADETTNSVLRISPVKDRGEEQVKVIIMREMDLKYLHWNLKIGMKTIMVPTNMDLGIVVHTIRDVMTRVNPDIVLQRGGGPELTERTAITPEEVAAAQESKAINYGKSFTEADELFTALRSVCQESRDSSSTAPETGNDSTIKPKRSDKTERKIGQIQRKMLRHPSFRNLKAGGKTTNTIRSALLIRWTQNGSKRVRYSTKMCERALSDLIGKQVLQAEVVQIRHEGGDISRDIVKVRYKLWMDFQSYINMLALFPDLKLNNPFLGEGAAQEADNTIESQK